jgi:osmotically-inducible protein OsmY
MSSHAESIQDDNTKIAIVSVNHPRNLQNKPWVKQPNRSRLTDTDLAAAAANAIECLTTVPQETIQVTARNGWLHLEGALSCRHQLRTLEEITRHLPGVRGITDSIAIKPPPNQAQPSAAG